MIAKLTGTLDETGPDWAIIDVSGVGYLVHCSDRTLAAMPAWLSMSAQSVARAMLGAWTRRFTEGTMVP